jgi:hypothetical protein
MTRLTDAWRALAREQRLTAIAAGGLFLSMFLPWYSKTDTFVERGAAKATQTISNAFQAFSFVEAAVLLVSAAVLAMLFARAERRTFALPGGDGLIVMIAGGWTALLIFYRLLDKPGLHGNQRITATVGVEWGIFIALLVALGLLYSGARMRALERGALPPEAPRPAPASGAGAQRPPLEDAAEPEQRAGVASAGSGPQTAASAAGERSASGRPRYPPAPPRQMSFEDSPSDG